MLMNNMCIDYNTNKLIYFLKHYGTGSRMDALIKEKSRDGPWRDQYIYEYIQYDKYGIFHSQEKENSYSIYGPSTIHFKNDNRRKTSIKETLNGCLNILNKINKWIKAL